jgi:hypothetical protein
MFAAEAAVSILSKCQQSATKLFQFTAAPRQKQRKYGDGFWELFLYSGAEL